MYPSLIQQLNRTPPQSLPLDAPERRALSPTGFSSRLLRLEKPYLLSADEKRLYYQQASAELNLPAAAVEKDFWVCWCLEKLFGIPRWSVPVKVLDAERTFLEKAMLLHEDTFRPVRRPRKPRMARHYYDLYCMIRAGVGHRAVSVPGLFKRIREHRCFYYPVSWVDYDRMTPGNIRLVRPQAALNEWKADYEKMRDVFFFDSVPPFEELIETVREYQDVINAVDTM